MTGNLAALLYLVSGILFILALRGLSSPASSRQGNRYGMIGMAIAVVTTLLYRLPPDLSSWLFVVVGIAIGGSFGTWRARTVQMTAMPQLVASFHALVGLAAVFVGAGALYAPQAFGIGTVGGDPWREPHRNVDRGGDRRDHLHRFDHRLPEARRADVGQADHSAAAPHDQYRARRRPRRADRGFRRHAEPARVLADHCGGAGARRAADHSDRRRRHAGRHFDAEFLFRLGGGGHRFHARQSRADHHRGARRLVGRDPLLHHVQGDEPLLHLGHSRRFRRRDRSHGCASRRGPSSRARPRMRPI